MTAWTQEHTGLDACVQRRAGVLARGFLELVAFQGSPSSYPHVQSTQRRRLKRMGCLCPGEPSRGPWKSASSPPCDLAGHGNPTHLRNPSRSPQRGHRNGTTPWAVGGAPPPPPRPRPWAWSPPATALRRSRPVGDAVAERHAHLLAVPPLVPRLGVQVAHARHTLLRRYLLGSARRSPENGLTDSL